MRAIYADKNIPRILLTKAITPIWKDFVWTPLSHARAGFLDDMPLPGPRWVRVKNEAEAQVLGEQVKAFGSGMNYARYVLYQRVASQISSVLSGDGRDGLGSLFVPFLPNGKAEEGK